MGCVILNLKWLENCIQILIAVPYHFQIKEIILRLRIMRINLSFDSSFPKARPWVGEDPVAPIWKLTQTVWSQKAAGGKCLGPVSGGARRGAEGSGSRKGGGRFGWGQTLFFVDNAWCYHLLRKKTPNHPNPTKNDHRVSCTEVGNLRCLALLRAVAEIQLHYLKHMTQ